jgi:PAS domain S-box-containing protein
MIMTDAEGNIRWINRAAERILGLEPETALCMRIDETFTDRDRELGVPAQERRIAAELGVAHNDRWHQRTNGAMFWSSGLMTALRDQDGNVHAFCKSFRDRTDLREQLTGMENAVREAQRSRERCVQSMARLAHEVRTPLAASFNVTALLKRTASADPATAASLQMLERQLEAIHKQVEELLDVTRLTTGKVRLELAPISVQDVVSRALETVLPDPQMRTRVRAIMPSRPVMVMADVARLQQVFVNLFANALKFTPPDQDISTSMAIVDKDVVVYVSDNGIGIPKELLPRIFDLFTQVPATDGESPKHKKGLGIGLAVVRELATLHGGSVQVRSDGEGHGTEFTVRLPLAFGPVDAAAARASPSASESASES